ncbi:hypothetical protein [Polyangium aurulentum]|nr:hypothetical protein [Polyangium aurulentum]
MTGAESEAGLGGGTGGADELDCGCTPPLNGMGAGAPATGPSGGM